MKSACAAILLTVNSSGSKTVFSIQTRRVKPRTVGDNYDEKASERASKTSLVFFTTHSNKTRRTVALASTAEKLCRSNPQTTQAGHTLLSFDVKRDWYSSMYGFLIYLFINWKSRQPDRLLVAPLALPHSTFTVRRKHSAAVPATSRTYVYRTQAVVTKKHYVLLK